MAWWRLTSALVFLRVQDKNTAPDGIWHGSTALSRDVATIVRRMKLLGFNAVRLPFSFSDL